MSNKTQLQTNSSSLEEIITQLNKLPNVGFGFNYEETTELIEQQEG